MINCGTFSYHNVLIKLKFSDAKLLFQKRCTHCTLHNTRTPSRLDEKNTKKIVQNRLIFVHMIGRTIYSNEMWLCWASCFYVKRFFWNSFAFKIIIGHHIVCFDLTSLCWVQWILCFFSTLSSRQKIKIPLKCPQCFRSFWLLFNGISHHRAITLILSAHVHKCSQSE